MAFAAYAATLPAPSCLVGATRPLDDSAALMTATRQSVRHTGESKAVSTRPRPEADGQLGRSVRPHSGHPAIGCVRAACSCLLSQERAVRVEPCKGECTTTRTPVSCHTFQCAVGRDRSVFRPTPRSKLSAFLDVRRNPRGKSRARLHMGKGPIGAPRQPFKAASVGFTADKRRLLRGIPHWHA